MLPDMPRLALALVALTALLGCPPTMTVDGQTVRVDAWTEAEKTVRERARVELDCDTPELHLVALHPAGSPREIEVRGCGAPVTYVPSKKGWEQRP